MPLLDTLLQKNIRCIDYECITEGGVWKGKRLVAFGRYAGIAGMVDFFRGLGARALALGYSTSLLNIGSSYMYRDVEAAMAAVSGAGASIAKYGLPAELSPLVLTFTGRGNVSKGAQEIAKLLPHRMVTPEEVPGIIANATGKDRTHTVYVVQATAQHMVRKKGVAGAPSTDLADYPVDASGGFKGLPAPADFLDADFDRAHYKANPEQYEGVFHVAVAPYSSAIVNCMYWDGAYPRLINLKQSRALGTAWRCLGICDISCDEQGSIELLRKFTSIDEPYYVYNTATDEIHEGEEGMSAPGVLFHAVDHLPSELPADASAHFGNALLPLMPQLAKSDGSLPWEQQTDLPEALRGAVITAHGQLTPRYKYIASLRAANERAKTGRGMKRSKRESFMSLRLVGHLFDTGIINAVLDVLEEAGCSANIVDVDVGRDRSEGTSMALQVFSSEPQTLSDALGAVASLVTGTDGVQVLQGDGEAMVPSSPMAAAGVGGAVLMSPPMSPSSGGGLSDHTAGNVLLLGAGFVSGPLADYLLRVPGTRVTVASMFEQEAINFAAVRPRCHPVTLNVSQEADKLNQLVSQHDLVVSLVPAPFHPLVARAAITNGKNMVTASYVSPELAELQAEAAAAGVVILNEVGLDPGIDHISAVALLDSVKRAGQTILSFSSNCGGLPAPEAAANRLGYKFSWSPRGVLTASRNAAVWLSGGAKIAVPGEHLMAAAAPYALFKNPAFDLEVLPNRDCRVYAEKYGIPDVPHIFRGTLRYGGFPKLMFAFATLGFLDLTPNPALTREADGQNGPDYTTGPPLKGVLAQCTGADPAQVLSGEMDDTQLVAAIEAKVAEAWDAAATSVATARSASDALVAADVNAKQAAGETVQQASLWCEKDTAALEAVLRDLDFFEAAKPAPRTPSGTALDTFTALLSAAPQLSYAANERDAALMQHEVLATAGDGSVTRHVSTLVQYGDLETKVSCMSLTVGVTAAIGVQLILDGKGGSATPGVHTPVTADWWQPMLAELAAEGIALTESSETLSPALASAVLKYLGDK